MKNEFKTFIKKNFLQLTMQVFSLVMLALATYITVRLAPLAQDIAVLKQQVFAVQQDHVDFKKNLITRDDLQLVITRIDKISARVDEVIGILLKK